MIVDSLKVSNCIPLMRRIFRINWSSFYCHSHVSISNVTIGGLCLRDIIYEM